MLQLKPILSLTVPETKQLVTIHSLITSHNFEVCY